MEVGSPSRARGMKHAHISDGCVFKGGWYVVEEKKLFWILVLENLFEKKSFGRVQCVVVALPICGSLVPRHPTSPALAVTPDFFWSLRFLLCVASPWEHWLKTKLQTNGVYERTYGQITCFGKKQTSQASMLLIQSKICAFFLGYHDGIAQSTFGGVFVPCGCPRRFMFLL